MLQALTRRGAKNDLSLLLRKATKFLTLPAGILQLRNPTRRAYLFLLRLCLGADLIAFQLFPSPLVAAAGLLLAALAGAPEVDLLVACVRGRAAATVTHVRALVVALHLQAVETPQCW